jgi:hypothetical protein
MAQNVNDILNIQVNEKFLRQVIDPLNYIINKRTSLYSYIEAIREDIIIGDDNISQGHI